MSGALPPISEGMALRKSHTSWIWFLALAALPLGACVGSRRQDRGIASIQAKDRALTLFLIDGLQRRIFEEELRAGNLPQLQRLISEGTYVKRGITAFPSVTGYTYYPFLTGKDAASSGLFGLRWFDRSRSRGNFRNYIGKTSSDMAMDAGSETPTLFDLVPDSHSYSINTFLAPNVTEAENTGAAYAFAKYRFSPIVKVIAAVPGLGKKIAPTLEEHERRVTDRAIQNLATDPRLQWITYASPDTYFHYREPGAKGEENYRRLVRALDVEIGRYREASRKLGLEDKRIYAVLTDHGGAPVEENRDFCEFFGSVALSCERGSSVNYTTASRKKGLEEWSRTDVVVAINGNTMAHLYFKSPGQGASAWRERPEPKVLEDYPTSRKARLNLPYVLASLSGVELVIFREGPGRFGIKSSRGRARISAEGELFSYQVIEGKDPLGYREDPRASTLTDGRLYAAETWLEATSLTRFPYGIVRLARLMRHEGAGDLVVTSLRGFDFGKDFEIIRGNFSGGHGGLREDQLSVPFVLSGAGVPVGRVIETLPSEDIGASLFGLMGAESKGEGRAIER